MTAMLAEAADRNLAAHAGLPCRVLPRSRVRAEDDLTVVDSGLACDTFNLVCRARLSRAAAPHRIQETLGHFGERGHPFSWWLGPGSEPEDLPTLLEDAGLRAAEGELAMGMALTDLPSGVAGPAGLVVRRVETAADLAAFAALSAANWTPPDLNVVAFYRETAPHFLAPGCRQWLYLGYYADEPVATAELTLGGDVAGLYNIGTRPDVRGRRIGSVMTWTPLRDAARQGVTHAILQASEMGQNLYARLGFRAFGTITEYQPHA